MLRIVQSMLKKGFFSNSLIKSQNCTATGEKTLFFQMVRKGCDKGQASGQVVLDKHRKAPVRKTQLSCSSLHNAPASHFSDPQTGASIGVPVLPLPSCRALSISVRLCNPWFFHLQNGYVKMKWDEAIGVWDGLCFTVNTPQIKAIIMQRKLISLYIILTCSSAQTERFLYWGNLGCTKNDVYLCQILLLKHQGKGRFAWFPSMACEKMMEQYVGSGTFWQLWQRYHCSLPFIISHTDREGQIRQWIWQV